MPYSNRKHEAPYNITKTSAGRLEIRAMHMYWSGGAGALLRASKDNQQNEGHTIAGVRLVNDEESGAEPAGAFKTLLKLLTCTACFQGGTTNG